MKSNIIKLFISLFCSAFVLAGCGGKSEEDTVKAYFNAVATGKADEAIALIDFSDAKAEEVGLAKEKIKTMLLKQQEIMTAQGGIKSIDVTDKKVSEDGKTTSVNVKVTLVDGTTRETTMELVKVDGNWKLKMR